MYDDASRVVLTIDPLGNATGTKYDAAGRTIAAIDPLGHRSTTVYDAASRTIAAIDPLGYRTTTAYDAAGRSIRQENALGEITTTLYDLASRPVVSIDPLEHRTTTVYDAAGRSVESINPLAEITTTVYDDANRVTATVDPLGHTSVTTYDDAGRVIAQTNAENETTQTIYDAAGRTIATVDPLGERTSTLYDAAGRTIAAIDPLGFRTSTVYDIAGQAIASVNPLNETTTSVYDPAGRMIATIDANNNALTNVYDAAGRRIALVDGNDHRQTFIYDAASREVAIVDGMGFRVTQTYDAAGQRILTENARQQLTTFIYDPLGREQERKYPEGSRITWTYDPLGNPTVIEQHDGIWTRTYDPLSRVTSVTAPGNLTLTFIYDAAGRREKLIDINGGVTTCAYDAANRPVWIVNPHDERTTYQYDAAGRMIQKDLANGTRATYTYDSAGRLTLLDNLESDDTPISSFAYQYDEAGRRTRVVEASGDVITWIYDPTGQLIAERRSGTGAYAHTFTYDPVGNRQLKNEDGDLTTSSYDAANRLVYAEILSGRTTYTFDPDGNQAKIEKPSGDITTHAWSSDNRLIIVQLPDDTVVTHTYAIVKRDGTILRTTTDDGTKFTRLLYDGDNVLIELDEVDAPEAELTYQPQVQYGNLESRREDAETSYYHYDAIGSTRQLTDEVEATQDTYDYTAFGEEKGHTGASDQPNTWVGQVGYQYDESTGYYNIGQRPYDAPQSQWMSKDPTHDNESNTYQYAGNAPIDRIDPSGEAPQWPHLLPQALRETFEALGFKIDKPVWGLILDGADHSKLHAQGWNDEWKAYFDERRGKTITPEMVRAKLRRMMKDPKYSKYLARGVRANVSYQDWGKIADKAKAFRKLKRIAAAIMVAVGAIVVGAADDACAAFAPVTGLGDPDDLRDFEWTLESLEAGNIAAARRRLFGPEENCEIGNSKTVLGLICRMLSRLVEASPTLANAAITLDRLARQQFDQATSNLQWELEQIEREPSPVD